MSHKFEPSNMQKLDNEWRRQNLPPFETLQALGLRSEDIVADIGCGIGYFTIPIAETIKPQNKVYALDLSEEMLQETEKRARFAEVKNIVAMQCGEYDLKLPDKFISFVLLANVLHEIEDKDRFIKELKRISKVGGKIAVIEWEKKPTEKGPAIDDRLDRDELIELFKENGIEPIKDMEFADCFYGLVGVVR